MDALMNHEQKDHLLNGDAHQKKDRGKLDLFCLEYLLQMYSLSCSQLLNDSSKVQNDICSSQNQTYKGTTCLDPVGLIVAGIAVMLNMNMKVLYRSCQHAQLLQHSLPVAILLS